MLLAVRAMAPENDEGFIAKDEAFRSFLNELQDSSHLDDPPSAESPLVVCDHVDVIEFHDVRHLALFRPAHDDRHYGHADLRTL